MPWCSTATLAAHGLRKHAELLQRAAFSHFTRLELLKPPPRIFKLALEIQETLLHTTAAASEGPPGLGSAKPKAANPKL